jgi:hypothetical protein
LALLANARNRFKGAYVTDTDAAAGLTEGGEWTWNNATETGSYQVIGNTPMDPGPARPGNRMRSAFPEIMQPDKATNCSAGAGNITVASGQDFHPSGPDRRAHGRF